MKTISLQGNDMAMVSNSKNLLSLTNISDELADIQVKITAVVYAIKI
tara:strand:+ start:1608 stop:1748 length:141 start_codon:yes stop_codon:yes gene_type:complete